MVTSSALVEAVVLFNVNVGVNVAMLF
jgi:hypothetical protein